MEALKKTIRAYYREDNIPTSMRFGGREKDCLLLTYGSNVVGGETERHVAEARFLKDPNVHHEEVDIFGRRGFSATREKIDEIENYLNERGFINGTTGSEGSRKTPDVIRL